MKVDLAEKIFEAVKRQDFTSARTGAISLLETLSNSVHGNGDLKIEAHPLGFLCVRYPLSENRTLRLHLWSRSFQWQQRPNWQIHDHIFGFNSIVLDGVLLNKVYESETNDALSRWSIYYVAYEEKQSHLMETMQNVDLKIKHSELVRLGQVYSVASQVLHRTKLVSPTAVSLVAAEAPSTGAPRVVGVKGRKAVNLVFSRDPIAAGIDMREVAISFRKILAPN